MCYIFFSIVFFFCIQIQIYVRKLQHLECVLSRLCVCEVEVESGLLQVGVLVLFQWARWENQAAEFHRTSCVMGLNLCEHKLSDLDSLSEKNHNKDVYRD